MPPTPRCKLYTDPDNSKEAAGKRFTRSASCYYYYYYIIIWERACDWLEKNRIRGWNHHHQFKVEFQVPKIRLMWWQWDFQECLLSLCWCCPPPSFAGRSADRWTRLLQTLFSNSMEKRKEGVHIYRRHFIGHERRAAAGPFDNKAHDDWAPDKILLPK